MIREIPLSRFIVGLRKLHLPQQLIVAISVTIRYFPAIREESGYIHDAMKLRDIHGLKKIECLSVPLILSATSTAEELSAAAVTRGIENPVKKTSIITLKMKTFDWITLRYWPYVYNCFIQVAMARSLLMVSIKRVSFSYPGRPQTLNDFSLDVADGECILLCGESGCGKTTVTKLINGLIPHFTAGTFTSGTVSAENLSVSESELYELALHIGSVFQNPKSQFFNLDATSELAFGLENQGSAPSYIHMRLRHTVSTLHLESLMKRNIFAMSGGEKQLLAFASVYMMHPSVFLLDEPTANLDNKTIELLRAQIALLKRQGHTIIIAEHRLWFLSDLIDRAVFIKQGHIQQIFSGASFFALPDTKRKAMGLRSLVQTELNLPTALPPGSTKGLSVENLACSFGKGKPIFEKLSFSAIPGEILAICGRNGIGKTTLIRCLCGFVHQYSGTILIDGQKNE
jgi:energy-coupling factor transport system ATP-binding protein